VRFLVKWVIFAIALYLTFWSGQRLGLEMAPSAHWQDVAVMSLLLGLVNALVRPLIRLALLPLNCLTLGIAGADREYFALLDCVCPCALWLSSGELLGSALRLSGAGHPPRVVERSLFGRGGAAEATTMIGRLLRALALGIGLYVLLTAVHYGTLWGLDQMRQRMETRLEQRYGADAVDREPPYKPGERWVMALDIQPSPYWQEAVRDERGVEFACGGLDGADGTAVATPCPVADCRQVTNALGSLWLLTQLGGLALAGYLGEQSDRRGGSRWCGSRLATRDSWGSHPACKSGQAHRVAVRAAQRRCPPNGAATQRQGHLLIVSGMSGAGKTLTLQTLEDIGLLLHRQPPAVAFCRRWWRGRGGGQRVAGGHRQPCRRAAKASL
jgi:hypothetical protein